MIIIISHQAQNILHCILFYPHLNHLLDANNHLENLSNHFRLE